MEACVAAMAEDKVICRYHPLAKDMSYDLCMSFEVTAALRSVRFCEAHPPWGQVAP